MKKHLALTSILLAALLTACIPSLNPFYTQRDVVFDSELLGQWREQGNSWEFNNASEKAYQVTVTDNGKTGKFSGHLFKIGERKFLDIVPLECEYATNQVDVVNGSMFPGHLLLEVKRSGSNLDLAFFDFEWLEKYLKNNPRSLSVCTNEGGVILTASTSELQQFVLKHGGTNELFQKFTTFTR